MNFKPKELLHLIERVYQTLSMPTRTASFIQKRVNGGFGMRAPGSQLAVWAESCRSLFREWWTKTGLFTELRLSESNASALLLLLFWV
jgi:hypothetical protein